MRKFIFCLLATAMLSIFAVGKTNAQSPCDYVPNCQSAWVDATPIEMPFPNPDYAECKIKIGYKFKKCDDGVMYFELTAIEMDASNSKCQGALAQCFPNGYPGTCDPLTMNYIWVNAFELIAKQWLISLNNNTWPIPNQYKCPNTFTARTVSEGGCVAWATLNQIGTSILHFIPLPCSPNGCCMSERVMCIDETGNIQVVNTTTEYNTSSSCENMGPLANPLDGYDTNKWMLLTTSCCQANCYIWSTPVPVTE